MEPSGFLLCWHLEHPCETSGWTLVGSQARGIKTLYWLRVCAADIQHVCPTSFCRNRIEPYAEHPYACFLTSASLTDFSSSVQQKSELSVRCIATVGLGNALRVGDPAAHSPVNTINIACEINQSLTTKARIEGLSIIGEAKSLAMIEHGIVSYKTHRLATGTGTDCSIIASKEGLGIHSYAGKHTILGQLIGQAAYQAVYAGIKTWKHKNPHSPLIRST